MKNANRSLVPIDQCLDLEQRSVQCDMSYREVIGSVLNASVKTRADFSYAETRLAQYAENAKLLPRKCIKQVFHYLVETKELGLR